MSQPAITPLRQRMLDDMAIYDALFKAASETLVTIAAGVRSRRSPA